jgi:hypothetical protein
MLLLPRMALKLMTWAPFLLLCLPSTLHFGCVLRGLGQSLNVSSSQVLGKSDPNVLRVLVTQYEVAQLSLSWDFPDCPSGMFKGVLVNLVSL